MAGTIWEITHADLERLRDWELMDFGWYEDCTGIAKTTSGEKVSVVSVKLGKNQSVDHQVDGLNYETWSQDPNHFLEVAEKARQIYDEQKRD